MSEKARKRFLDFSINTTSVNSGSQQYGAGLSLHGNSGGGVSSTAGLTQSTSGLNAMPRAARARGLPVAPKLKSRAVVQPGLNEGRNPTIAQTEMILSVKSPTAAFQCAQQFTLQPALSVDEGSGFRFITPIAQQYEKYELLAYEVEYKPLVSVFADAGKAGQVIVSFSYDALSGPSLSLTDALATDPHVSGMPNQAILLRINCVEAMKGGKFTRQSVVPMADLKTYDAGRVFVYVDGVTPTDPGEDIGQIIVRYKVRLLNPRPQGNLTPVPNYAFSRLHSPVSPFITPATTANVLAYVDLSTLTIWDANPLNVQLLPGPGSRSGAPAFRLPKGCWALSLHFWINNGTTPTGCDVNCLVSFDDGATWSGDMGCVGGGWTGVPSSGLGPPAAGGTVVRYLHITNETELWCPFMRYWNGAATGTNTVFFDVTISQA